VLEDDGWALKVGWEVPAVVGMENVYLDWPVLEDDG
jgi:hypothetical protein